MVSLQLFEILTSFLKCAAFSLLRVRELLRHSVGILPSGMLQKHYDHVIFSFAHKSTALNRLLNLHNRLMSCCTELVCLNSPDTQTQEGNLFVISQSIGNSETVKYINC